MKVLFNNSVPNYSNLMCSDNKKHPCQVAKTSQLQCDKISFTSSNPDTKESIWDKLFGKYKKGQQSDSIKKKYVDFENKLLNIKTNKSYEFLLPNYQVSSLINVCKKDDSAYDTINSLSDNKRLRDVLKYVNEGNYKAILSKEVLSVVDKKIDNVPISGVSSDLFDEDLTKIYFNNNDQLTIINIDSRDKNAPVIRTETIDKKYNDNPHQRRAERILPDGNKLVSQKGYNVMNLGGYNTNIPTSQRREIYTPDGELVFREVIQPSDVNKNICEVSVFSKESGEKKIGTVARSGDEQIVSREFVSPEGVKTQYLQKTTSSGYKMAYKISDKHNNAVFNQKISHEKIDENHFKTIKKNNFVNEEYNIEYSNDSVTVHKKDLNNNAETVATIPRTRIDNNLLDSCKQLPGDILFNLGKRDVSIVLSENKDLVNDSMYLPKEKTIYISKEMMNNPFSIAHEAGHVIDVEDLNISKDKELIETYKKELAEYRKNSTNLDEGSIEYFTQNGSDSLKEVTADTIALMSGICNNTNIISMRGVVLQQNFPQTIACISKQLNNRA